MDKEKRYYITIKNTDIIVEVSLKTYYSMLNNDPGELKEKSYEVTLSTIKKHPRLYNKIRRMLA